MPREEEPEEILNPEQERERNKQRLERARTDLWIEIAQNHIPTAHQLLTHYTTTKLANSAKIAHICRRQVKPSINPKQQAKDLSTRVKKVAKEMMSFWKRNEKEERELRKKAEREALELRKREEEMREAQRQARKLNFLITQTELYSHFIGKKLGNVEDAPGDGKDADDFDVDAEGEDEQVGGSAFNEIDFDDEDETALVARAKSEAKSALAKQRAATRAFDLGVQNRQSEVNGGTKNVAISESTVDQMDFLNPSSLRSDSDITQPEMLTVQLKSYQLKGLNWLANLYEQGINGILADEMGLGKTVQSIALMAYLAEKHGIWGPFLVVSPASTLPNWQQEVARFAPQLKVLPYWGDPDDRKTLRGLLNPKKTGVRDAPFHVAITSYQLIVTDIPQFNRIRWQYMILDEAQAIKSSSSQRWKTLLKMNSRNRLLLTGTPIQNSMQELWSLLHFIMPTLFDSHEEFSDWFSKDIESHVEDNGTLNEHQLRRLHMILKPFMLRRIKRDVENELADKIEVELRCQLSARQKVLYQRLKQKISVRELMDKVASTSSSSSGASTANNGLTSSFGPGGGDEESEDSLMNIVMQFRKVCNHPELFERADVASPFMCIPAERIGGAVLVGSASSGSTAATRGTTAVEAWSLNVPYNVLGAVGFSIPKAWYRAGILDFGQPKGWGGRIARVYECHRVVEDLGTPASEFGFVRLADLGVGEFAHVYAADILARWVDHILIRTQRRRYFSYLNRNGFARPVNSMLCIVNHENTSGKWDDGLEPDVPGRGFTALCSVANDLAEHGILGRLPIAYLPAALAAPPDFTCSDRSFTNSHHTTLFNPIIRHLLYSNPLDENPPLPPLLTPWPAPVSIPPHTKIITNSGKMLLLNTLLPKLKEEGHRVLIFFQMTLMMDLMEEYLAKRQYSYLRLDGSTSIFDRRDLVFEWQSRPELFIFLLSTRAGGLGINLTAADTVIFYDSDWNPTVDQQAMDRSHRLGQTRQVTVYRLITAGTIEERILQRARQKDQIQKVVISGGEFKQQVEFKPKEVLSLLLEDEEMEERGKYTAFCFPSDLANRPPCIQ
ncbi:SNF2 family N-terminal domain-containing protein [Phlyctochytrium arcticum]|nr:SNF2 family N-terminal domain-containing protein [Phlyctochytrium arcticum]